MFKYRQLLVASPFHMIVSLQVLIIDYDFWLEFNNKYPRSNDSQFREIYRDIASDRADKGAHINVSRLTLAEYDELIKITYPDNYINNKELYDAYRDWVFMFPA